MNKYAEMITGAADISPTVAGARRAADIVAALAPPPSRDTALSLVGRAQNMQPVRAPRQSLGDAVKAMLPGVVGAVVGAIVVPKHRVLGALAGHAVGATAMPIIRDEDRKGALCQLAVEGAGIIGALTMRKHGKPAQVAGWLGGVAVGAGATAFVPGSPARDYYDRWRSR